MRFWDRVGWVESGPLASDLPIDGRSLPELRRLEKLPLWAATALLGLVATAAFVTTLFVTGPQLTWDSKDSAQIARQISRGEGNTTQLLAFELVPETLSRLETPTAPWPNLLRTPLAVYPMSFFFNWLGPSDRAAVLWSGLFYVASAILLVWCFRPAFGRLVSLAAALVFALSRCGVVYARTGLTEPSAMFFLILSMALFIRFRSYRGCLGVGLVLGLCSISRPVAAVWVAVFGLAFAWGEKGGWRRAGKFAACGLAYGVPIIVASMLGWERGHGAAAINLAYRVGDVWPAVENPLSFAWEHWSDLPPKMIHEMGRVTLYLFDFGGASLFSALAPFGLLFSLGSIQKRAAWTVFGLVVFTAAGLSVFIAGDAFVGPLRYFDPFFPLVLPWAVQAFLLPASVLGRAARLSFWGLLLLFLLASGFQAVRNPTPQRSKAELYRAIAQQVPSDEIIVAAASADPPGVAWYSDRRVIYVPVERDDVLDYLEQRGVAVKWQLRTDTEPTPHGYHLAETWPGGLRLWRRDEVP